MSTTIATKSAVEAAKSRYSIRAYKSEPVSDEVIHELLQLAGRSPSAWNIQPWKVIVVRGEKLQSELQAVAYGQPQVGAASAVLVITSDMVAALENLPESVSSMGEHAAKVMADVHGVFDTMPEAIREGWGRNQTNIFLGYLLLLAETLGLGTSPMLGFDQEGVKKLLGLPDHAEVAALVAIGWPDQEGHPSIRKPLAKLAEHRS